MLYNVYDDYLDVFGDDIQYFDDLLNLYPSFDIVTHEELMLALSYGDVLIVAELHNSNAKYNLKCYIGKLQTVYTFNHLNKLKDKTIKMDRFILKHSCCIFDSSDLSIHS
jgi:hypothetical protein